MRFDGTDIKPIVKVTAPAPPPRPARQGPPPTPDEVVLSPDGKRALVRANRNVYMITVPPVGGAVPTVSAAASSSVPTWRLTKVGGDFIGWTADSKAAYFSIGRSFFLHDIALAGGGGRREPRQGRDRGRARRRRAAAGRSRRPARLRQTPRRSPRAEAARAAEDPDARVRAAPRGRRDRRRQGQADRARSRCATRGSSR